MPAGYALITLCRDEVAPRFDMTGEVLVVPLSPSGTDSGEDRRHLVLAHASNEELCDVIARDGVSTVVCGGIEEDYYHYLRWKRIDVICNVMGRLEDVLERLAAGSLETGDCLYDRTKGA